MPYYKYKKGYSRFGRYGGLNRYVRRNYPTVRSRANLAYKALRVAKYTAGLLNPEFKVHDVEINNQAFSSAAPFIQSLSTLSLGTDVTDRIGRSIRNKSLQIRFTIGVNTAATRTKTRIIIFKDTQPKLGTPTLTDILDGGDIDAFKTFNSRNRIIFLRDMSYDLSPDTVEFGTKKMYLKLNDHTLWDSAGDIIKGKYYLFAFSSEITNTPSIDFHSRLRYLDN